jgi:hypothetical protein
MDNAFFGRPLRTYNLLRIFGRHMNTSDIINCFTVLFAGEL